MTVVFSANDSLITSQEVIDSTPVANASYADLRQAFIVQEEERLFRKCFGWDFYLDLMADRVSYTPDGAGATEQYTVFRDGTNYSTGDHVLHDGRVYTAKRNTTGVQRPTLDLQNDYWIPASKFATAEYQYIWVRYLRAIIAFSITQSSIFYRAVQDTAKGLVRKTDETTRAAGLDEISRLKADYKDDITDMLANFDDFMQDNKDISIFANYKGISECGTKCRQRRYMGFNTNDPTVENRKIYEYGY